jgi:hypothetical protein
MKLCERLQNASKTALMMGAAGASICGSVVAGVGAVGGTIVGPEGTFFGYVVGAGVGAAVGGAVGCTLGFIGGLF